MGNLLKKDIPEPAPKELPYLLIFAVLCILVAGFLLCVFLDACRSGVTRKAENVGYVSRTCAEMSYNIHPVSLDLPLATEKE